MSVFRTSQIEWKGKAYDVTPSMSLLSNIERSGKSLIGIATMASSGHPQISLMSEVIGSVLRSSGAPASDEDIIQIAFTPGNANEFLKLWNDVYEMISPEPTEGKKPDAPEGK